MKYLSQLRAFVSGLNAVDANKIDAWPENTEVVLTGIPTGNQIEVCLLKYTAVVDIDGWPHATRPVEALFVALALFLDKHPAEKNARQLPKHSIDFEIVDDNIADIQISVDVKEPLYIVEDEQGEIEANDKRWRLLDEPSVTDVNTVGVGDAPTPETDATYTRPCA